MPGDREGCCQRENQGASDREKTTGEVINGNVQNHNPAKRVKMIRTRCNTSD